LAPCLRQQTLKSGKTHLEIEPIEQIKRIERTTFPFDTIRIWGPCLIRLESIECAVRFDLIRARLNIRIEQTNVRSMSIPEIYGLTCAT
jgi:hypothetical protein